LEFQKGKKAINVLWIGLFIIGIFILAKRSSAGGFLTLQQTFQTYYPKAVDTGTRFRIQPSLILAVIQQESAGQPDAFNDSSGAIGLMQITTPALTDYNNKSGFYITGDQLFNPGENINVGAWYLAHLLRQYYPGDISKTLRAYNAGIGTVAKSDNAGKEYADKVLQFQEQFRKFINV
jgi:soluble lytic murein transglycosylase-like protein